jgi:hypothetical protein
VERGRYVVGHNDDLHGGNCLPDLYVRASVLYYFGTNTPSLGRNWIYMSHFGDRCRLLTGDDNMQTAAGNKRYNGQVAASPNGPAGKLGLYVGVGMLCLMCAWSFFQCQTNRSSSIVVVAREATTSTTAGASSAAAMLLPSVAAFTNPLPGPSPPDRRISYSQVSSPSDPCQPEQGLQ